MRDSGLDLVSQRIPTVLGPLEIALPAGAVLQTDPGAVEGSAWYWSPQPGSAVVTVSDGEAELRTDANLLALERSLDDTTVVVLRDEADDGGHGHPASGDDAPTNRAKFRFWQRGGWAVRLGYRLDESAAADWRAVLDRIVDSARLR